MEKPDYIIGIDEAGRGPLAGPVYVGCVLAISDFDFGQFSYLDDSKQMTESQRKDVFSQIQEFQKNSQEMKAVASYTRARTIDRQGINTAIQSAIDRAIDRLEPVPETVKLYLDGGLSGPKNFPHQETIVGGDGLKPVISLASVVAKVTRDRRMKQLGEQFSEFDFAQHKGYGTVNHRNALKKYGPSKIHRKTYIKNILHK